MGYELDFSALVDYLGLLLKGVGVTLGLTAIAATLGIALSIGGAATARWGLRWARALVALYVELIRNTPFIVQLFFVFFGLPSLGLQDERDAGRGPGDDHQPDRLCDRDRAGRDRGGAARPARGRPRPRRRAGDGLLLRHPSPGHRQRLSGPGQPDRHHHAGIGGGVADRGHRSHPRRRLHPVAHLPRLRDLLRRSPWSISPCRSACAGCSRAPAAGCSPDAPR